MALSASLTEAQILQQQSETALTELKGTPSDVIEEYHQVIDILNEDESTPTITPATADGLTPPILNEPPEIPNEYAALPDGNFLSVVEGSINLARLYDEAHDQQAPLHRRL